MNKDFSVTAWCCSHLLFKLNHPLVHISIWLRMNELSINNQTGSPSDQYGQQMAVNLPQRCARVCRGLVGGEGPGNVKELCRVHAGDAGKEEARIKNSNQDFRITQNSPSIQPKTQMNIKKLSVYATYTSNFAYRAVTNKPQNSTVTQKHI